MMMTDKLHVQAKSSKWPSFMPMSAKTLQRKCSSCPKKRRLLQRQAGSRDDSKPALKMVEEVLRSPGQPLDPKTRAFFEPRFTHDFSRVRVHTDLG